MGFSRQEYWSGVPPPSLQNNYYLVIIIITFILPRAGPLLCYLVPKVALKTMLRGHTLKLSDGIFHLLKFLQPTLHYFVTFEGPPLTFKDC